jgi:hypothetical protein
MQNRRECTVAPHGRFQNLSDAEDLPSSGLALKIVGKRQGTVDFALNNYMANNPRKSALQNCHLYPISPLKWPFN